jgi:hypothetical protein
MQQKEEDAMGNPDTSLMLAQMPAFGRRQETGHNCNVGDALTGKLR